MNDRDPTGVVRRAHLDELVGKRIRLLEMPDDPCPIEVGDEGEVTYVGPGLYEKPQIWVTWDSGRTLMLIEGIDKYEVIGDQADGGTETSD